MPRNIAVLDLGTNTFHLQMACREGQDIITLSKLQIPVKLGEGGINKGYISEAAYQRGQHALDVFAAELAKFDVHVLKAFATSAIRDASNGPEFMEEVRARTGIRIETISGEEEALYICEGVRHSLPFTGEPYLVMDIGGGSVEFIIANQEQVFWKQSFRLGAARLIEKFHRHDPVSAGELRDLFVYLDQELFPLKEAAARYGCRTLVGSAGSFESLVELVEDLLRKKVPVFSAHSHELDLGDYYAVHRLLLASTHEQRSCMKGLVSFRVEMMVMASCLVDFVVDRLQLQRILASAYSLKEGMIYCL